MTEATLDPEGEKKIPRWSDRLHRLFEFLASGGGSMFVRKPDPAPVEEDPDGEG